MRTYAPQDSSFHRSRSAWPERHEFKRYGKRNGSRRCSPWSDHAGAARAEAREECRSAVVEAFTERQQEAYDLAVEADLAFFGRRGSGCYVHLLPLKEEKDYYEWPDDSWMFELDGMYDCAYDWVSNEARDDWRRAFWVDKLSDDLWWEHEEGRDLDDDIQQEYDTLEELAALHEYERTGKMVHHWTCSCFGCYNEIAKVA